MDFYPRPPRGGRPGCNKQIVDLTYISIHALREEGDQRHYPQLPPHHHFYPRPPRGGRPRTCWIFCYRWYFYPRPPRGGRLYIFNLPVWSIVISIHALREEGDVACAVDYFKIRISIHALREEGDLLPVPGCSSPGQFLSTPSARRATCITSRKSCGQKFLSTPSARRATYRVGTDAANLFHFYPRPPRGGRLQFFQRILFGAKFLSTPSARRATV